MTTQNIYSTSEKQLVTTLAWFRSRYALFMGLSPERKATQDSIEEFGNIWIGDFKEDWTEAFTSLCRKNVLTFESGEYTFTEYGNTVKGEIEFEVPFYKYEYDNYFQLEEQSAAHSLFCQRVYGLDLSQHGLIDQAELSILIDLLKKSESKKIADIGCGNGKITEWISGQTQTYCVGIDISSQGIQNACERTKDNNLLHFEVGNLNNIHSSEKYNSVIFLDTLYYSHNVKNTIGMARELLEEGGRIYAYFSQWIMDTAYNANLLPDKTHLANVLRELGLEYSYIDLSVSGINHWKRKLEVLENMKNDFVQEGSIGLWEYRHREALRYATWGDDKYARYLYEIKK